MGEALDAGLDLGLIAACYVGIGLALLIGAVVGGILRTINVSILGTHPFGGLVTKAENAVTAATNTVVQGLEKQATKFESGLGDALALIIGIPLLLAVALKDLLQYLWHTALSAFVSSIVGPVRTLASQAIARVTTLEGTVASDLTEAKRYADASASSALSDAKTFASHWIDNAVTVLNGTIRSAIATAEGYADTAVSKLRGVEDAAVAAAVGLAAEAKNAGINAAAGALSTAEGEIAGVRATALAAAAGALTTAESYAEHVGGDVAAGAAAALAQAEGVVSASVDAVKAIAIDIQHDLGTIEGQYGALGLATLIASIPAIATLVNALATETGLENEDCRQKVKGICATPSSAWTDLLGGLVAVGVSFSLLELAEVADPILVQLAPVIVQAA